MDTYHGHGLGGSDSHGGLVALALAGGDGVGGGLDDGESLGPGSVNNSGLLGLLAVFLLNGGSVGRSLGGG